MIAMLSTKQLLGVLSVLLVCACVAYASEHQFGPVTHPEDTTIGAGKPSFDDLLTRFRDLAKDKGAEYAFDVLRTATIPVGTDIHLIAHEIGHELYAQKGIDGMSLCTQEFGNGCSHSLVIEAMQERGDGPDVQKLIDDACHKAEQNPDGGLTAYTMCYHGLGHGVFAYYQYSFPETVKFCMQMGTKEYDYIQGYECIGGAAMELVSGGGHDKEAWEKARARYFRASDPLAPCNTDAVPAAAKSKCYVYMSPYYMELTGGNIVYYTDEQLTKGMSFCTALPFGEDRSSCIGGFGKDFVSITGGQDLRKRDKGAYSDSEMRHIDALCRHTPDPRDQHVCESYAISMFFWGGYAEPSTSTRFCSILGDSESQDYCFTYLAQSIAHMIADREERAARCDALGARYQKLCLGN